MNKIYFDYASTTPCDPEVVKAMNPYFYEKFGNASSPHTLGRESAKALEDARGVLADFIGAQTGEIVFNSGATEGNNHAIGGIVYNRMNQGDHIIVSAIEHHSILEPIEQLVRDGFKATFLPVDGNGLVDPQAVVKAVTDKTILVAIMHASNEIGTIQPIQEVSQITKMRNIPLLVDACQTVGHIPVDVNQLGCDLLTLSAHKFYGPKGVGGLYIREGLDVAPFLLGGDQERKRRASTQNIAGIVGMAKAIEICRENMVSEKNLQTPLRDLLLEKIPQLIEGVKVNGDRINRLPNNAHFSFAGLSSESLLMSLDMQGMYASMGSACTSGAMEPSHVLQAIGVDDSLAMGALRITIGRWTTQEHIEDLLKALPKIVKSLRI
ncbi:MAG: cysteine desulfurase [Candidatus Omnitrophica bacterium]|nr:cysteine desulfurase [Candidatus Omnitrophota bacterium]